jgi:hypothetical protein
LDTATGLAGVSGLKFLEPYRNVSTGDSTTYNNADYAYFPVVANGVGLFIYRL